MLLVVHSGVRSGKLDLAAEAEERSGVNHSGPVCPAKQGKCYLKKKKHARDGDANSKPRLFL